MTVKNIFDDIPDNLPQELIEKISGLGKVKIERIVSRGHASPDDFWYKQEQNEYVILLQGKAGLIFENRADVIVLKPGDYLNIPAYVKHRVAWTGSDEDTIWLAVHY